MSQDAYVFGDLSWPMPDPGLVAVWRAMSIDGSRWDDWEGFVDGAGAGTIGAMVDQVAAEPDATFELELTDTGVRLRARLDAAQAACWQGLAIAWRLAADLGASGEFAWCPCASTPPALAYHGVIGDYASQWQKLTGPGTQAIAALPGRREVEAMITGREPAKAAVVAAPIGDEKSTRTVAPIAREKSRPTVTKAAAPVKAAAKKASKAAKPSKASKAAKPAKGAKAAKKKKRR